MRILHPLCLLLYYLSVRAELCHPNRFIESFYFVHPAADRRVPDVFFVKVGATAYNVTEFHLHNAEFSLCIASQDREMCGLPVFDEHAVQLDASRQGPTYVSARLCSSIEGCLCTAQVLVQCCQEDSMVEDQRKRRNLAITRATKRLRSHVAASSSPWSCHHRLNSSTVVIGIKSASYHWEHRDAIRDTWLPLLSARGHICAAFIIGDASRAADGGIVTKLLHQEQRLHSDLLLQEIPAEDSYDNLVNKTLHFLKFVHSRSSSAQHVMLLDDDVYVFSDRFYYWISSMPVTRCYAGEVYNVKQKYTQKPLRHPRHRNYVKHSEYPLDFFPNYAVGNAYLLSRDAVDYIVKNMAVLRPVGPLEDVSIGVWLLPLMLFPEHVPGFVSVSECEGDGSNILLLHGLASADMIRTIHQYHSEMELCAACQRSIHEHMSETDKPQIPLRLTLLLTDLQSSPETQAALVVLSWLREATEQSVIEVLTQHLTGDEVCVQQLFEAGYPVRHVSSIDSDSEAQYIISRDVLLLPISEGDLVRKLGGATQLKVRQSSSLDRVAAVVRAAAAPPLIVGVLSSRSDEVAKRLENVFISLEGQDEDSPAYLTIDRLVFIGDKHHDIVSYMMMQRTAERSQELQTFLSHHSEQMRDVYVGTVDVIMSSGAAYGAGLVSRLLHTAFPSLTMQSWPLNRYGEVLQSVNEDGASNRRLLRILVVSVLDGSYDDAREEELLCDFGSNTPAVWPKSCQDYVEGLIANMQAPLAGVVLLSGEPVALRPLKVADNIPVIVIGTRPDFACTDNPLSRAIYLPLAATAFSQYDMQTPLTLLPSERSLRSDNDWRALLADKKYSVGYLYFRCDRLHRQQMFDELTRLMGEEEVRALGACRGLKHHSDYTNHLSDRFANNYLDVAVQSYRPYKFVVAFENSQHDGYVTEKLVNAYLANAVPIYWGATDVGTYFNSESMINCNDFESLRHCAEYVHRVNLDDALYLSLLSAPPLETTDKWCDLFEWHAAASVHCANHSSRAAVLIRNTFSAARK